MKELKCEKCGELFTQDYRNLEHCDQCQSVIEAENKGDPELNESDNYDLRTCHTV